ncbi:MAG: hypothetical protein M3044_22895, partial [Thermoproteota archaeon]|nr:hypothetical protein [Thermoproteota archaeon]
VFHSPFVFLLRNDPMTKTGSKHNGTRTGIYVITSLLLRHREISEIYNIKLRSLTLLGYLVIKSGFLLTDTISVSRGFISPNNAWYEDLTSSQVLPSRALLDPLPG